MADVIKKRVRHPLNAEMQKIRTWLLNNRGILRRISENVQPHISEQAVQQIAYGRTRVTSDHRVVRELRAAGWPGVK